MLCWSPMSMNRWRNIPALLRSCTGMSSPHCNIYCSRPAVFRQTDFPPALGPEMSSMRLSPSSAMSRRDIFLPCFCSDSSSNGWQAAPQSIMGRLLIAGFTASKRMASCAFARMKSISPRKSYAARRLGTCGRSSSENATSMRITSRLSSASSSRMRLLACTTSAGSMNTVFPLADSSCIIPFILRLSAGATGITRRPSRSVGDASFSTSPSACARRRMVLSVREMLPAVRDSSLRNDARVGEAESFTLPNLSTIPSMALSSEGSMSMSPARRRRLG